ncbi:MAG: hypothetical protein ABIE03_04785 [Patescibacteria group bacterium]
MEQEDAKVKDRFWIRVSQNFNLTDLWDNFIRGPGHWVSIIRSYQEYRVTEVDRIIALLRRERLHEEKGDYRKHGVFPTRTEIMQGEFFLGVVERIGLNSNRLFLASDYMIAKDPTENVKRNYAELLHWFPRAQSHVRLLISTPTSYRGVYNNGILLRLRGLTLPKEFVIGIPKYKGGIGIGTEGESSILTPSQIANGEIPDSIKTVFGTALTFEIGDVKEMTDLALFKYSVELCKQQDYLTTINAIFSYLLVDSTGRYHHFVVNTNSYLIELVLERLMDGVGEDQLDHISTNNSMAVFPLYILLKSIRESGEFLDGYIRGVSLEENWVAKPRLAVGKRNPYATRLFFASEF